MIKKVLLLHNYYRHRGGEDSVFENESKMLKKYGIQVIEYIKHNDDIIDSSKTALLSHTLDMVWNRSVYNEVSNILKNEKPDIAHFHNTFQIISPSAYKACLDNNVPVIQTLHNFRLLCPGGLLQRDGIPCELCIGHIPMKSILHGCYRGSVASSAAVTIMLTINRLIGSYKNNVHKYIALTDFSAKKFISGGINKNSITVKPNFIPNAPERGNGNGNYIVYVGRLSEEKGIETLLNAWTMTSKIPLIVIGDGPLANIVQAASDNTNNKIQWIGFKDKDTVLEYISNAEALILPSICYEGFPLTILEAYACGTPVLVSRIGNLDEIVIENVTGFKFNPGDASGLANMVSSLWSNIPYLQTMRQSIRDHYNQNYSEQGNYKILINIYNDAIDMTKSSLTE